MRRAEFDDNSLCALMSTRNNVIQDYHHYCYYIYINILVCVVLLVVRYWETWLLPAAMKVVLQVASEVSEDLVPLLQSMVAKIESVRLMMCATRFRRCYQADTASKAPDIPSKVKADGRSSRRSAPIWRAWKVGTACVFEIRRPQSPWRS